MDLFNPLSDIQTAAGLIQAGVENIQQRFVDFVNEQMRRGAQVACPGCNATAKQTRKNLEEAERKRQKCDQHGEACPELK